MKPERLIPLALLFLLLNILPPAISGQTISQNHPTASDYRRQGITYYERQQYEQAAEQFEKAIRLKPDYPEALNDLGITYGAMGRHREAIDSLK